MQVTLLETAQGDPIILPIQEAVAETTTLITGPVVLQIQPIRGLDPQIEVRTIPDHLPDEAAEALTQDHQVAPLEVAVLDHQVEVQVEDNFKLKKQ